MKEILVKGEPKPEKRQYQNKVATQGVRTRFTPRQKLNFITEFQRFKQEEPALTQSAFLQHEEPSQGERLFEVVSSNAAKGDSCLRERVPKSG